MSRLMGEGGGRGPSGIPAAKTESAMLARKSFYCELCNKGYSRMNEYEAHENSYDHQHKKRFLEMKAMQRDPTTAEKRRERERRQEEKAGVITIKPIKLSEEKEKGGFKKGGFKSAFGEEKKLGGGGFKKVFGGVEVGGAGREDGTEESDTDGENNYDPANPTD
ncbi:hypothetical protein RUND412_007713 [Rhizina undulata]